MTTYNNTPATSFPILANAIYGTAFNFISEVDGNLVEGYMNNETGELCLSNINLNFTSLDMACKYLGMTKTGLGELLYPTTATEGKYHNEQKIRDRRRVVGN